MILNFARARQVTGLSLCLLALGCNEGAPPTPQGPPPVDPTPRPAPTASVGNRQASTANAQPQLGVGAIGGGPAAPAQTSWTAQQAANQLFQAGVVYSNGVVHRPGYVWCRGVGGASSDGFTVFECYLEVAGIRPYNVRMTVAGPNRAEVAFLSYAG